MHTGRRIGAVTAAFTVLQVASSVHERPQETPQQLSGQVEERFRLTDKETQKLQADRTWLFHKTRYLEDGGFFGGAEGSMHAVLYEIGRADRLYYFSFADGYHEPLVQPAVAITKWSRVGDKVRKEWAVSFKPTSAHPWKEFRPAKQVRVWSGTLLELAYHTELGYAVGSYGPDGPHWMTWAERFIPDPLSAGWRLGKADLVKWRPLIAYHFGSSGDVSLKAGVAFIDSYAKWTELPERESMKHHGPPVTTAKERTLIEELRQAQFYRPPTTFGFLKDRKLTYKLTSPSSLRQVYSFKANYAAIVKQASAELSKLGFKRRDDGGGQDNERFEFEGRYRMEISITRNIRMEDMVQHTAGGWVRVDIDWTPSPPDAQSLKL